MDKVENIYCQGCGKKDDESTLLLCDKPECNRAFHTGCLKPALSGVPEGEWFCPLCVYTSQPGYGKPPLKARQRSWKGNESTCGNSVHELEDHDVNSEPGDDDEDEDNDNDNVDDKDNDDVDDDDNDNDDDDDADSEQDYDGADSEQDDDGADSESSDYRDYTHRKQSTHKLTKAHRKTQMCGQFGRKRSRADMAEQHSTFDTASGSQTNQMAFVFKDSVRIANIWDAMPVVTVEEACLKMRFNGQHDAVEALQCEAHDPRECQREGMDFVTFKRKDLKLTSGQSQNAQGV